MNEVFQKEEKKEALSSWKELWYLEVRRVCMEMSSQKVDRIRKLGKQERKVFQKGSKHHLC